MFFVFDFEQGLVNIKGSTERNLGFGAVGASVLDIKNLCVLKLDADKLYELCKKHKVYGLKLAENYIDSDGNQLTLDNMDYSRYTGFELSNYSNISMRGTVRVEDNSKLLVCLNIADSRCDIELVRDDIVVTKNIITYNIWYNGFKGVTSHDYSIYGFYKDNGVYKVIALYERTSAISNIHSPYIIRDLDEVLTNLVPCTRQQFILEELLK